MEYTPIEQQTLHMMRRKSLKNLFKSVVLSIVSKLGELRSDVAKERKDILTQEMEILKVVHEKDTEIRTHETETVKMVDKKDSVKRQFSWRVIGAASTVLVIEVGVVASALD